MSGPTPELLLASQVLRSGQNDLLVPAATHATHSQDFHVHHKCAGGGGDDPTGVAKPGARDGSDDGSGAASLHEVRATIAMAAASLQLSLARRDATSTVVEAKAMETLDWNSFVREKKQARGLSGVLAEDNSIVYKEGRDGKHLSRAYGVLVAGVKELYGGGPVAITDAVIGQIVAHNLTGESSTIQLLYGIRTLCKKAFGPLQVLEYEAETTKMIRAAAKKNKAAAPRYTTPVDLQNVWLQIVLARERVAHLPDTSTAKAKVIRDCTIFLERHDAISRSDCETKCDMRQERMFRVFDENGEVHTDTVLSQRLDAALVGDGGIIQRQYFQPKDPRRKGDWSEVVETSPLRLHLIVDKNKPWLSTPQRAGYLCSVRSRRDYARCLEAIGAMELIPMGTTWTSITQKDVQAKKLAKLKPSTIANIVKNGQV